MSQASRSVPDGSGANAPAAAAVHATSPAVTGHVAENRLADLTAARKKLLIVADYDVSQTTQAIQHWLHDAAINVARQSNFPGPRLPG